MEQDLNNIMQSISKLPQTEKSKLLTYLIYQSSNIPEKDKEIIEYMTASSERLKNWMESTDNLIEKMDNFFNDLKKSA